MAQDKTSLGDRMKGYENVARNYLVRRMPVILRIDGRSFHTFCKGFEKTFDYCVLSSMDETMLYLCQNIQNCVFGYTQSDEISLVLVDYKTINTEPWFDNNIQKISSVGASMATMKFNYEFSWNVMDQIDMDQANASLYIERYYKKNQAHQGAVDVKQAMFDCRCFNVPETDVCNYFIWRQKDAIRNSILSVGQANFSHKELQKKNCNQIKEMLKEYKNINWDELPADEKQGAACYKDSIKNTWVLDGNIPVFSENREFIEKHIIVEEMV